MFKDLLTPLVCKYHRILTKGVKTPHVSPHVMVVWGPRDTRRCTGRWAALPWPLYTPGPGQQGAQGASLLFGVAIKQLCSTQLCAALLLISLKSFILLLINIISSLSLFTPAPCQWFDLSESKCVFLGKMFTAQICLLKCSCGEG